MIRLGKAGARERLEFGGGAFLVYRTATTIDHEAGTQAARAFFRAVREGQDSLENFGLSVGPFDQIQIDDALSFGVSSVVSLTEIAMRCVSEWGGIADENDVALPLNRANMCALLQDSRYFQAVREALLAPLHVLAAEGNGSKLSRRGGRAGAGNTARRAKKSARRAPAEKEA